MNLDRTGWIVVVTCSLLLVWWMFFMTPPPAAPQTQPTPADPGTSQTQGADPTADPGTDTPTVEPVPAVEEQIVELRSDDEEGVGVLYRFTTRGGGVLSADLLEHWVTLEKEEHVQLNQFSERPIGALMTGVDGPQGNDLLNYAIESQSDSEIVFVTKRPDGLEVRKRYYLNKKQAEDKEAESHLLHCEVTLTNPSGADRPATDLSNYWFYGGSIAPQLPRGTMYTGFFYKDGGFTYKPVGFLNKFLMRPERKEYTHEAKRGVNWGGASNQFFAISIQDPEKASSAFWVSKFAMVIPGMEERSIKQRTKGLECAMALPAELLDPGQSSTTKFNVYMGPKEYERLAQLPDAQKDLMAYGKIPIMGPLFGWIIKPVSELLVIVLDWLYDIVGNFGVAILILTMFVRLIIWPVHAKAHRVSKQMAQLTPKIQDLKKKYPDPEDQAKLQQEQMKLWSDYGINPMGGCLPAFLQLPIFLGYFRMLSSAAELRHQPFVAWINDLSMPDTMFHIAGFPINLLPIIMTVTSYLQFSMMPKTGDKNQQMIFKFMPLMFLVFCYPYASALALYWTWQNIISMGQTYLLNKRDIPELVKKKRPKGKKGFFEKLQEQAEAARQAQEQQKRGGGSGGGAKKQPSFNPLTASGPKSSNTGSTNFDERGPRKQKPKRSTKNKRRKKR